MRFRKNINLFLEVLCYQCDTIGANLIDNAPISKYSFTSNEYCINSWQINRHRTVINHSAWHPCFLAPCFYRFSRVAWEALRRYHRNFESSFTCMLQHSLYYTWLRVHKNGLREINWDLWKTYHALAQMRLWESFNQSLCLQTMLGEFHTFDLDALFNMLDWFLVVYLLSHSVENMGKGTQGKNSFMFLLISMNANEQSLRTRTELFVECFPSICFRLLDSVDQGQDQRIGAVSLIFEHLVVLLNAFFMQGAVLRSRGLRRFFGL